MTEGNDILTDNFIYKELKVGDSKYLIGVRKQNDLRQIILTNLIHCYEENLSVEDIVKRCEDLNPALIDFNFEEIVDDLLIDLPKYVTSSTLDSIELESKIEDGRFWFSINLKKCNIENFRDHLMESIYFSFAELHHRYNCLLDIVHKKDQEIAEYKEQGVKLLRKSLVTEPFTEKLFETKLQNTKPVDEINTILDVMNFCTTFKCTRLKEVNVKQEPVKSDENNAQLQSISNLQTTKRSSSRDVRCAVAPKLEKKLKVSKKDPNMKFL